MTFNSRIGNTGLRVVALAVGLLAWFLQSPANGQPVGPAAKRTLVFVVPGLTGNDGFWTNVAPGKVTFASELTRATGPGTETYPYLWNGAFDFASREEAARKLALLIDQKASGFDKVCLVGHSFGGDIALRAAGLCQTKIDLAVCLATPHTYLMTQDASQRRIYLPVFCSWESRQNIKMIINVFPENDTGIVNLANEFKTEQLTEKEAIPLTQSWQEHTGFPRLVDDSMNLRMNQVDRNLTIDETLNVADANIPVQSFVPPGLGTTFAEHTAIHSRRIGFLIGELVRDGATKDHIENLKTLVQPKDADAGQPVDLAVNQAWIRAHVQDFTRAGWRLSHISVSLVPEATPAAHNPDGSLPSPFVAFMPPGNAVRGARRAGLPQPAPAGRRGQPAMPPDSTTFQVHTATAQWNTNFVLWNLQTQRLSVQAYHDLVIPTDLGGLLLTGGDSAPPATVTADPGHASYWDGTLTWEAIHF